MQIEIPGDGIDQTVMGSMKSNVQILKSQIATVLCPRRLAWRWLL